LYWIVSTTQIFLSGPLWIVVELCEHGNLLSFLRKNRQETPGKTGEHISSLDPLLRVRIAYDVAKGMHYLEEKKVMNTDWSTLIIV
jgi:serine/threonine protein kinase